MQPKLKAVTIPHLVLSVLVSAVFTAVTAILQYLNGSNLSVSGLLAVAGVAFGGAFGTGVLSLEKSPQVQQTVTGLEQLLSSHLNALGGMLRDHSAIIQQATHDLSNVLAQVQAQNTPPVQQQPVPIIQMPNMAAGAPMPNWSVSVSQPPVQARGPAPLPSSVSGLQDTPLTRHFGDTNLTPVPPR